MPPFSFHIPPQGIFVDGLGELQMHGKLFTPTWTCLAATANVGDRTIKLQVTIKQNKLRR
jgi:hypothetical protein